MAPHKDTGDGSRNQHRKRGFLFTEDEELSDDYEELGDDIDEDLKIEELSDKTKSNNRVIHKLKTDSLKDRENQDTTDEDDRERNTVINRQNRNAGSYNNRRSGHMHNGTAGDTRQRRRKKVQRLGLLTVVVLFVAICVIFLLGRLTPTKEKYNAYKYFDVDASDQKVTVVIDGQQTNSVGAYVDGQLYLPQEYIADQLNVRFYYDKETNGVLYTDSEAVYTFLPEIKGYSDSLGRTYDTETPVVKVLGDVVYLNFEYVAAHTNCSYVYADAPSRVIVRSGEEENTCLTVVKKDAVRYRAGIKSKVLEEVKKDDKLYYVSTIDDWTEVVTKSGFTGYIKTSSLSEPFSAKEESSYQESYTTNLKDHKICLGWFQVTNKAGNANASQYVAQASGLNTISPTWYSIVDNAGNLSSLADAGWVSSMHDKGLEVWPLLSDFEKDIDYASLYASRKARTRLINQLIKDARSYGYDGINVDCENVKSAYAKDYLQMIRELSIACQANGLVMSIDNYKPQSFNSFYRIKEQASFADYVIIMGYDEHYNGSDAGSVASLPFVKEGIEDALTMVPKEQLINAVPFYTRIWNVSAAGTTSKAVGMQAAVDNMSASGAPALWDESVGQYFGSYDKDGATVKIWFEEERSIEEKLKVMKENQLGGIACWKLGMEKPAVWSVIQNYMSE